MERSEAEIRSTEGGEPAAAVASAEPVLLCTYRGCDKPRAAKRPGVRAPARCDEHLNVEKKYPSRAKAPAGPPSDGPAAA